MFKEQDQPYSSETDPKVIVPKLKVKIRIKFGIIKFLLSLLLFYLIYLPSYYELLPFLSNYLGFLSYAFNLQDLFLVLLLIIAVITLYFLWGGRLIAPRLYLLVGFTLLLFISSNYISYPFKTILLIVLYPIAEQLSNFQILYSNYKEYDYSYQELAKLDSLMDQVLRKYLFYGLAITILTYLVLLFYDSIRINFGLNLTLLLAIFILPIVIILLFNSPNIFKTLSIDKKKKD